MFPVRYKLYILPTQCICVFGMVLTVNSECLYIISLRIPVLVSLSLRRFHGNQPEDGNKNSSVSLDITVYMFADKMYLCHPRNCRHIQRNIHFKVSLKGCNV
jgi:hypothetical protein